MTFSWQRKRKLVIRQKLLLVTIFDVKYRRKLIESTIILSHAVLGSASTDVRIEHCASTL
jgi:hypothetical protein